MSTLEIFSVLAAEVDRRWRLVEHSENSFSKIAYECLFQQMHLLVDYESVLEWLMGMDGVCEQSSLGNSFGQPPLTLYTDEKFRIELLFWHTGAAAIHHHTFSGAFLILQGETIHTLFNFKEELKCYDHFRLGNLSIDKVELLKKGDVREIIPGEAMIHSTFHIDMPTVTVVIRTHCDNQIKTELEYRPPGVAINTCHIEPLLVKKVQALEFLQRIHSNKLEQILKKALENVDIFGSYLLLRQFYCNRNVGGDDFCIHFLKEKYGNSATVSILKSIEEEKRRITIYKLRASVIDSGQRFFLALLINLPNLSLILQSIKLKYHEHEPFSLIYKWSEDIINQNTTEMGMDVKLFICILKSLIDRKSYNLFLEEVSMDSQYKTLSNNSAFIEALYKKISSSTILYPLFV